MIPLSDTSAFQLWVANTVLAMSGIETDRQCSESGKRALTCAITRVVECQEGFESFFDADYQAFSRPNAGAVTNKHRDPLKLH